MITTTNVLLSALYILSFGSLALAQKVATAKPVQLALEQSYVKKNGQPKSIKFNKAGDRAVLKNTKGHQFLTKLEEPVYLKSKKPDTHYFKANPDGKGNRWHKFKMENGELVQAEKLGFLKRMKLSAKGYSTMKTMGQLLVTGVIGLATYSLLASVVQSLYGRKNDEMSKDDSYEFMNQADAAMNPASAAAGFAQAGIDPSALAGPVGMPPSMPGGAGMPAVPPSMATGGVPSMSQPAGMSMPPSIPV